MYDVIIVGGGPAGSTLARLLGDKMKVLIIDQRDLEAAPGGFEKCCGGLLAPDAQEMLARFGLGLPKPVLASPQLFAVRAIDLATGQERFYPRNYLNVKREAFDRWLISLLSPQVERRWRAQFLDFRIVAAGVEVSFLWQGKRHKATGRLLVGADGAQSRVRRKLAGIPSSGLYVAVQQSYAASRALPYYTAVFDPAVTDFYGWMIPKDDMLLVGAAIPAGPDVLSRFERLAQKLQDCGFAFSDSGPRQGTLLLRPRSRGTLYRGTEQVILIGEAAGWISPSSAEGISYAFRSALALCRALEQGFEGALGRYRRFSKGLGLDILGKRAKSPAMYWPFLRRLAMGSGLLSIDIIE
ncbi:MAG TPA: FAD-binding protein [Bacillota bacterium]|nr:FAD-binding protein [Bacillota bacterium]HQD20217.1 FAD-binding protein [Bacillota bacterium]